MSDTLPFEHRALYELAAAGDRNLTMPISNELMDGGADIALCTPSAPPVHLRQTRY